MKGEVREMTAWPFWAVLILLVVFLASGVLFALREFRKKRKLITIIIYYILLAVFTVLILKLLFAVFALAAPF